MRISHAPFLEGSENVSSAAESIQKRISSLSEGLLA